MLVETFRRLHVMVRSFGRVIANNTLLTSSPGVGTVEVCIRRICELSHHALYHFIKVEVPTCLPQS